MSQNGSMKKIGLLLASSLCLTAQTPVVLGTAGNFAVLAFSTITNTGNSVVDGNIGLSPGTQVIGFGPGIVVNGVIHAGDAVAGTAQNDLTAAYNDAAARPCIGPVLPGDLGNMTLLPGVYCNSSEENITGTVTLNGNGDPNAIFIFKIGSTLKTAVNNSNVNLIGGAKASNVFWQVGSSATLNAGTAFNGTIMANIAVTVNTGAVLNGRALARNGAVTLQGNMITNPSPSGGAGSLSLTCAANFGPVGQPYASALVAANGTPPLNYSIIGGSLPTGLALNASTGAITGTPAAAGTFSYLARVTDSGESLASSNCGLLVGTNVPPPSVPAPPTLILVIAGLALTTVYLKREQLLAQFRRV